MNDFILTVEVLFPGILMIKCVAFSLVVLDTLKWDCEIKTNKILSFLPLKNNSVTIDF